MGSEDPPLRRLARRVGCENSKFFVYLDALSGESGDAVADYLVVAPKARDVSGVTGVAVLPLKGDRIGLVRVYRHPIAAFGYEVPRGFVDEGETPAQAARRELEEETGLACGLDQMTELGTLAPDPGILAARVRLFMAGCQSTVTKAREGELGHAGFRWHKRHEVEGLLVAGAIQDAITLVTIYRAGFL